MRNETKVFFRLTDCGREAKRRSKAKHIGHSYSLYRHALPATEFETQKDEYERKC